MDFSSDLLLISVTSTPEQARHFLQRAFFAFGDETIARFQEKTSQITCRVSVGDRKTDFVIVEILSEEKAGCEGWTRAGTNIVTATRT